jgi:hypothetical protein
MSTIKAILEASADGTLHLPLPPELRQGKLNVVATVEPAESVKGPKGFGCLKGKIWIAPDFDEPLEDFNEYLK